MAEYNKEAERRSPTTQHRASGRTGRRSTDIKGVITVRKLTLIILLFLVDVVCLAGDTLLLRHDQCL